MGVLYGRVTDNRMIRATAAWTIPIIINGNGSYAGAPAKDEDAQYPMTNLYLADRYTPWSTNVGASATSIKVQVDLAGGLNGAAQGGTDRTVSSVGLLGLRGLGGAAPPTTIIIGYRTRAQGYAATGYTIATSFNTGQARDSLVQFSTISARYWEIDFTFYQVEGFALGNIWLGNLLDLGIGWSSNGGAQWSAEHNVLWSRTAGGHATGVQRGDAWAKYSLRFDSITNATRSLLNSGFGAFQAGKPIVVLDENNVPRQFIVMGGPTFSQRFNGLYDAVVDLEMLG